MATTVDQVAGFLEAAGLKFRVDDDLIRTGFHTDNYRDTDGDAAISLVIAVEDEGQFLKVVAPNVYKYPDGPHKAALFQTLLGISWDTKMIQFEYDQRDGEVRAIIEFPLRDALLTQDQLLCCVHSIAGCVDEYHEKVVGAMTRGEIPSSESAGNMDELWREFQEFLEQKRRAEGGGNGHGLPT